MSPVVLGIDTSGSWCSVALLRDARTHARREKVGNAHSTHLLAQVDAVLDEASITLGDCDVVAFAAGPGSFTGLRVACAAAQGLAFGIDRPVAVIGTLDAIAHSVIGEPDGARLVVAQDARMGEVYWSLYVQREGRWRSLIGPALDAPERLFVVLRERVQSLPLDVGCGNAWDTYGAALDGIAARVTHRDAADAADVAALGAVAWHDGKLVDAAEASPLYVRNQVASTTAERALRGRPGARP